MQGQNTHSFSITVMELSYTGQSKYKLKITVGVMGKLVRNFKIGQSGKGHKVANKLSMRIWVS